MRLSATLALVGFLAGCQPTFTRMPQDNFTLHAGQKGVQPFVAAVERQFGSSAETEDVNFPSSDPARLYRIDGTGVTVVVSPMPDDRCSTNAPIHSTYNQGEFRIDLVYRTSSLSKRGDAKRMLMVSAKDSGDALVPFKEC